MASPLLPPVGTHTVAPRETSLPPELERGRSRDPHPTPLAPRARSLPPEALQPGAATRRIPFSELVGPQKAQELNDRWGHLHGPRIVDGAPQIRDHEREVVNPQRVVIPADKAASFDLPASLNMEALKAGQTFLWAMGKSALLVAPETVVGVDELSGETRKLGHPTLFSMPEEARAAGELKWNGTEFCINLGSGRYSAGHQDLGGAQLQDVAQIFGAAGLPVTLAPVDAKPPRGSLEHLAGKVGDANEAIQLLGSPEMPGTILALPPDQQERPMLAMWRRMLQPGGAAHRPAIQAALGNAIDQLPPDLRSRLFIAMAFQGLVEVDPCLSPPGTPGSILNLPPDHQVRALNAALENTIAMRAPKKEATILAIKEAASSLPPQTAGSLPALADAALYHHKADPAVGDLGQRPFHHEKLGSRRGAPAVNTFVGGRDPIDRRAYDKAVRQGEAWLQFNGMSPENAGSTEARMARMSLVLMEHFQMPVRILRVNPTGTAETDRQILDALSNPDHGRRRNALILEKREEGLPQPVTLRWDQRDGKCSLVSSTSSEQPVLDSDDALREIVNPAAGFVCIVPDDPADPLVELANRTTGPVEDVGQRFGIGRAATWSRLSQELTQCLHRFEAAASDAAPKKVLGLSVPIPLSAEKKEALDNATQGLQGFAEMLAYAAKRPAMVGTSAANRIDGMLRALGDTESRLTAPSAKAQLQEIRQSVAAVKKGFQAPD